MIIWGVCVVHRQGIWVWDFQFSTSVRRPPESLYCFDVETVNVLVFLWGTVVGHASRRWPTPFTSPGLCYGPCVIYECGARPTSRKLRCYPIGCSGAASVLFTHQTTTKIPLRNNKCGNMSDRTQDHWIFTIIRLYSVLVGIIYTDIPVNKLQFNNETCKW